MEQENKEAERELHAELIALVGPEAPGGWSIALIKVDFDVPEGSVVLDHVGPTGHVLWHDSSLELQRALYEALRRHRENAGTDWTRASLVLSEAEMLSANYR